MTASAVYDTQVRHRRLEPPHMVRQRVRLAYLDLEELPEVIGSRTGWSTRPAPVWFRRRDYLDGSDRPLADALGDLLEERTGSRPTGPVRMLTQLRTWGWLFNPLTTYYCFAPGGETIAQVVLEITNTPWHERFWYVLDTDRFSGRETFTKDFHVSPFLPMGLSYRCRVTTPGERLAIRFELGTTDADGRTRRVFDADLTGRREPLDSPLRPSALARSATQTVRVSAGIYAHAALLSARGARFHRHPTAPEGDVGRPPRAHALHLPRPRTGP